MPCMYTSARYAPPDASMYLHGCDDGCDVRLCVCAACVVCVCFSAHARECSRTHACAPKRASPFPRRRRRVVRLVGVPLCEGVQREHRRLEHRISVNHAVGMRRSRPAARLRGGRARSGVRCACAHTYRRWLAPVSTCVGVGVVARRKDGIYVHVHIV